MTNALPAGQIALLLTSGTSPNSPYEKACEAFCQYQVRMADTPCQFGGTCEHCRTTVSLIIRTYNEAMLTR